MGRAGNGGLPQRISGPVSRSGHVTLGLIHAILRVSRLVAGEIALVPLPTWLHCLRDFCPAWRVGNEVTEDGTPVFVPFRDLGGHPLAIVAGDHPIVFFLDARCAVLLGRVVLLLSMTQSPVGRLHLDTE